MPLKKKNSSVQKVVKKIVPEKQAVKGGKKNTDYVFAVGRRKTAVARIRLFSDKGDNLINERSVMAYMPEDASRRAVLLPLIVTGTQDAFRFTVKVVGGGVAAQADAIAHGLARALVKVDEAHKKTLRDHGLMTRDPRMKESRKIGTGGKARRAKQSPKR